LGGKCYLARFASTGYDDQLQLVANGWQVVGDSPLSFEGHVLPVQASLKLVVGFMER